MIADLFRRLNACECDVDAQSLVGTLVQALGFAYFSYAVPELPSDDAGSAGAGMLLTNYPQGWQSRYRHRKYQAEDPVMVLGRREVRPFAWGDDVYLRSIGPNARRLFFEAREFGIASGFAIPVHGPGRTCGLFSVAGPEPRPFVTDVGNSEVHTLLAAAQSVHAKFVLWRERRPDDRRIKLSEQERICLLWTSQGKTAWEVAQIIGRSKATVDFHLRRASGKLGASNKLHAACKAGQLELL